MRARHDGPVGNGADRSHQHAKTAEVAAPSHSTPAELLDYIAAMVQELRTMSARAGYGTLAGLLQQAYDEARRRRGGR
jgi:hypothetical protein